MMKRSNRTAAVLLMLAGFALSDARAQPASTLPPPGATPTVVAVFAVQPAPLGVTRELYFYDDGTLSYLQSNGDTDDAWPFVFGPVFDLDGDGIDDAFVTAPLASFGDPALGLGEVYVHSGADGSLLAVFLGLEGDTFGVGYSLPGDLNGDGVPDLVVSAQFQDVRHNIYEYDYAFSGTDGSILWVEEESSGRLVYLAADLDWDDAVTAFDVLIVLDALAGAPVQPAHRSADINSDGVVDFHDLHLVLAALDDALALGPGETLPPAARLPTPPLRAIKNEIDSGGVDDGGGVEGDPIDPDDGDDDGDDDDGDDDDGDDDDGDDDDGDDDEDDDNCKIDFEDNRRVRFVCPPAHDDGVPLAIPLRAIQPAWFDEECSAAWIITPQIEGVVWLEEDPDDPGNPFSRVLRMARPYCVDATFTIVCPPGAECEGAARRQRVCWSHDMVAYRLEPHPFKPLRVPRQYMTQQRLNQQPALPYGQVAGVGARYNGDASRENLARIELWGAGYLWDYNIEGERQDLEYVVRRTSTSIELWNSGQSLRLLPGPLGGNEYALPSLFTPMDTWLEWVNPTDTGPAGLEVLVRNKDSGVELCITTLEVYRFKGMVFVFGGFRQANPTDPPRIGEGVYNIAVALRDRGYDAHMYGWDEMSSEGRGRAFEHARRAVESRGVTEFAIIGYSWGGASAFHLSRAMARKIEQHYQVRMTAYIDAVSRDPELTWEPDSQHLVPLNSMHHLNYYQTTDWPRGQLIDRAANTSQLIGGSKHGTIDDIPWIQDAITDRVTDKLSRP